MTSRAIIRLMDTYRLSERLAKLMNDIVAKRPEIMVVYLFGSFAGGEATEKSDVDLAFLFDRSFYKKDPYEAFKIAQIIGTEIGDALNMKVDVSLLNEASVFFSYEVVTSGVCLYEKDHRERILYEVALKGQYYDFKPFIMGLRQKKIHHISRVVGKGFNGK